MLTLSVCGALDASWHPDIVRPSVIEDYEAVDFKRPLLTLAMQARFEVRKSLAKVRASA